MFKILDGLPDGQFLHLKGFSSNSYKLKIKSDQLARGFNLGRKFA
jgi:hypothetical protein